LAKNRVKRKKMGMRQTQARGACDEGDRTTKTDVKARRLEKKAKGLAGLRTNTTL